MSWPEALQWTFFAALLIGAAFIFWKGRSCAARWPWTAALTIRALGYGLDAYFLGKYSIVGWSSDLALSPLSLILILFGLRNLSGHSLQKGRIILASIACLWAVFLPRLGFGNAPSYLPVYCVVIIFSILSYMDLKKSKISVGAPHLIALLTVFQGFLAITYLFTKLPPFFLAPILWITIFATMVRVTTLEEGREALIAIGETHRTGVVLIDESSRIVLFNGSIEETLGKSNPLKTGMSALDLFEGQARERFINWLRTGGESTFTDKGADIRRETTSLGTLLFFSREAPGGRLEDGSKNPLEEYVNSFNGACILADPLSGYMIQSNREAGTLLGLSQDDIPRIRVWSLAVPGGQERFKEKFEDSLSSGPVDFSAEIFVGERMMTVKVEGFRAVVGGREAVALLFEDAAEDRHVRDEGGLRVAGVAHDLGNVLQTILACCDSSNDDSSAIEAVRTVALRGGAMARRMVIASTADKDKEGYKGSFDLENLLMVLMPAIEKSLPPKISLKISVDRSVGEVSFNSDHFEQIFLNLILNSRDALGERDGGIISVTASRSGPAVMVEVSDNGPGIAKEDMPRIFNPGFSTKGSGKGRGIGLAVAKALAEKGGGSLEAKSSESGGTVFLLSLPAGISRGIVLVIDQDPLVRATYENEFAKKGYEIITAACGEEGLNAFRRHREDVILVVTELLLPGLGGRALLERLKSISPETRVIVSTHSGLEETARGALEMGAAAVFSKPVDPSELTAHLT